MTARKSKPAASRARPRWTAHPLAWVVLATAATLAAAISFWNANASRLIDRRATQLTLPRLQVEPPPPPWIAADLKRQAFEGSRLDELNLLDAATVRDVAAAFEVLSWVEAVRVVKNRAGVRVELEYRVPVAIVEFGQDLVLPVDRRGVALDGGGFNPAAAEPLLRISVEQPQTGSLSAGEPWPDARVVAAAMVAEQIHASAAEWGLRRIRHLPLQTGSIDPEGDFELSTARGNAGVRVIWGSPPGYERPNEAPAASKLAALKTWVSQNGSFDQIQSPQLLDLRSGTPRLAQGMGGAEAAALPENRR